MTARCESRLRGDRSDGTVGSIARCHLEADHDEPEGAGRRWHQAGSRRWDDDGMTPNGVAAGLVVPIGPGPRPSRGRPPIDRTGQELVKFWIAEADHERLCAVAARRVLSPSKLLAVLVQSFLDADANQRASGPSPSMADSRHENRTR